MNLQGDGEKERDLKIDGDGEKGEENVLAALGHHHLGCERGTFWSLFFLGGS